MWATIQGGADGNLAVADSEGRTPAHHAARRNHLNVLELLLSFGGAQLLLQQDFIGCTPIHLAGLQNQVTMISYIVDALSKDESGTSPLHESARLHCLQVIPANQSAFVVVCIWQHACSTVSASASVWDQSLANQTVFVRQFLYGCVCFSLGLGLVVQQPTFHFCLLPRCASACVQFSAVA